MEVSVDVALEDFFRLLLAACHGNLLITDQLVAQHSQQPRKAAAAVLMSAKPTKKAESDVAIWNGAIEVGTLVVFARASSFKAFV